MKITFVVLALLSLIAHSAADERITFVIIDNAINQEEVMALSKAPSGSVSPVVVSMDYAPKQGKIVSATAHYHVSSAEAPVLIEQLAERFGSPDRTIKNGDNVRVIIWKKSEIRLVISCNLDSDRDMISVSYMPQFSVEELNESPER